MAISPADVKKLREETSAGVMDCKKALEEAQGDYKKALEIVKQKGMARAEKKSDRETSEGYIASYVHSNNKSAALVEINCETDYVARNSDFQDMAKNIAMQVVAMKPANVQELLEQDFIKNPSETIEEFVKTVSGKIGEKFVVARFVRYEVGESQTKTASE
ncbi:MAG: translation elongation factor Ts [Microgenomates group bacterium]